jgi:diacylglycerol kinase family enzyme
MKFLMQIPTTHYRATVDGKVIGGDAIIIYILNAGSIGGVMGIDLPQIGEVSINDGYLDLYAVTKGVQPLRAITHHLFNIGDSPAGIYHWRGKEITLEADTPQDVWIDGEIDGKTPFTTTAIPQAIEIVVPA